MAAARERVRYCRPTLARKLRRERISLRMRSAIILSLAPSDAGRASMNSSSFVTGMAQKSIMDIPPTVTARASFLSLLPAQSGQGYSPRYSSYSSRMAWLCVSR